MTLTFDTPRGKLAGERWFVSEHAGRTGGEARLAELLARDLLNSLQMGRQVCTYQERKL